MKKNLIVIGGGAAGFFCAITAAETNPNLRVIILEKTNHLLSKVKISGGGRCNITHHSDSIADMARCYPRGGVFLKKAFQQFFTTDTIAWFSQRGVPMHTEADQRMFPQTNSSQTVVDCLMDEAEKYNITVLKNTGVKAILRTENDGFLLQTQESELHADFICVACGGFSKITHFDWLQNLGHEIVQPIPSLFTFNLREKNITELMGISLPNVRIKIAQTKFEYNGVCLITHWGLSGPVVLKLSAFAARWLYEQEYRYGILVNWANNYNETTLTDQFRVWRKELATRKLINDNPLHFPNRFWLYLLQISDINAEVRWAELPAKQQNKLIQNITAMRLDCQGKTTYKEEFVTAGGIDIAAIDPNTMESKLMKNLFFAGEILNIDGITGGFNFQNAWTTGYIAGKSITKNT